MSTISTIEQLSHLIGLPLLIECADDNTCHTTTTAYLCDTVRDSIDTWPQEDFDILLNLVENEDYRRKEEK